MKPSLVTRSAVSVLVAALVLASAWPPSASAFCRLPKEFSWKDHAKIPVFVREDTHQWLLHRDLLPWTREELHLEIEYALEVINDTSAAAHPPLVFAGTTDKNSINDAIVIQPTPFEPEEFCHKTSMNNVPPSKGQKIRLGISTCGVRWEHWTTDSGALVMRGALLHEFGHALGLAHVDGGSSGGGCADEPGAPILDCDPYCGVMGVGTGFSWEAEAYYRDDVLGLQAIYSGGYPQALQNHRESHDGKSWFVILPSPGPPLRASFGAFSSSSSESLSFVFRGPDQLEPRLDLWDFPTADWFSWWEGPREWFQLGKVGAALRPEPLEAYGFFELNEGQFLIRDPQRNPRKIHMWTRHTQPGSPDRIFMDQTHRTHRHGIDGAYDPVTGDRFAVWRDTDNRIRVAWIDGETDEVRGTFLLDQYAYENPEIACSDSPTTPYRCLLVYPTTAEEGSGEHVHITRWWQFRPIIEPIIGGVLFRLDSPPNANQNGYLQFGPVSVAYNEATDEFLFAWKNPGRCWFTALKPAAPDAAWHDERSHCPRSITSGSAPALGSAGGFYEGINNSRP